MSLTTAQLKAAIKAHEAGQPRPEGVTWTPGQIPQFLSADESAELAKTGVMPESARKRFLDELKYLTMYDANGNVLTAKDKDVVLAGYRSGDFSFATAEPVTEPDGDANTTVQDGSATARKR